MSDNVTPAQLREDARRTPTKWLPAWWDECADWHEGEAHWKGVYAANPETIQGQLDAERRDLHAAAALACRTFALMMRRERTMSERTPREWLLDARHGERVCLWVKSIEDDGSWGWDADCGGFSVRATHPRYCEHCGGRVVLAEGQRDV